MPPGSSRDPRPRVLVVASRAAQLRRWDEVLRAARAAGVRVRCGYVSGRPTDPPAGAATAEDPPHRLAATRTPSPWRRPLLATASSLATPGMRARLAARFDPWLRHEAREADVLVALDDVGARVAQVAGGLHPELRVRTGEDGLRRTLEEVVPGAVSRAVDALTAGRGEEQATRVAGLLTSLAAARELQELARIAVPTDPPRLRALPAAVRDPDARASLVDGLARLGALPAPVATAYRVRDELDRTARTQERPGVLGAEVLAEAARLEGTDPDAEVEWTCLALEVVFHRELHSDDLASPLLTDPEAYLAPVRETEVWRTLLTSPVRTPPAAPPATPTPALADAHEPGTAARPPWQPDLPHRLQVLMLPGAYGGFQAPVADALRQVPAAQVRSWRRQEMPGHLRSMGVTRALVRQRLAAARGAPVEGYDSLAGMLAAPTDVLVVDWADKGAVLATLLAPAGTRVVLRVHGVDALRPWIHLLDWDRVDALVCVSAPLLETVREVVGARAAGVPAHVVPNLVDLDGFAAVAEAPRDPGTLCVVGWAQRVKDPSWALEVLARLRAHGGDWRLLLVGRDFDDRPTASGAAYAARFRARALEDDVRDHVEYTGFVRDLAPVLARAGVVLSSSLRESQPVGMAEAVAAGALPVVRDWPMLARRGGARAVWPSDWVVADVDAAVERILRHADPDVRDGAARRARAALHATADPVAAAGVLREVALGTVGRLGHLTLTGRHAEAEVLAREVLVGERPGQPLLHQAAASAGLAGEPTLRRDLLQRWSEEHPHPYVSYQLRRVVGQLRELSPGWRPALTVGPVDPDPSAPGLRVLHVLKVSLPHRQSGYAVRSFYLLREQARAGLDVVAATALDFPPDEDGGGEVPDEEVVGQVRHLRLRRADPPEREFADERLQAFAAALEEVVARERPDVIHVHSGHRGYELAVVALAVGEAAQVPVVYEVRGFFEAVWTSATDRAEVAELYRLRRAVEAECLHRAAAVVTLSGSMREDLLARTRQGPGGVTVPAVPPERVFVVPNGVDVDTVEPRQRREDLVRRLGLEDSFVFGYVSNLDHPREGHELLVEAVRGLREDGVPATALVVGDGARAEELRQLARRRGVDEHVVFTGQVPHAEVGDYYALLDVFVVPRVDERAARLVTPLKPYEAMAMGLPVVVSDLPALREIVGADERGLSFPAGDAAELQRVLRELARDPSRRAELGALGRSWVAEHRTWRSVAGGYADVYGSIRTRDREA